MLKELILQRIQGAKDPQVWTPRDFLDLGSRDAVDKTLQRLVKTNQVRRIDRGLYDIPKANKLTGKLKAPDYRKVIDAVSRRDHARILIDGLTAANDLGLTNAVPAQINVLTDSRLKSIQLDNLLIKFKQTAPSKLLWADRPAMRIVQALHWLRDTINTTNDETLNEKLLVYLNTTGQKQVIINDLLGGLTTLPAWMQTYIKKLLLYVNEKDK